LKKEPNSGILEAKVGSDGILDALGFREAKKGCFGGKFQIELISLDQKNIPYIIQ
jgi:hypothetical protein